MDTHDSEFVTITPLECSAESVQDDDGLLRNVLLCGNKSQNGYEIPPEAFGSEQDAKRLYEGKLVFFDHVDLRRGQHPFNRSAKELGGVIKSVRMKDGKPYGDIKPFDSEPGRFLRSLFQEKPDGIGLSHIAKYDIDKTCRRVRRVERIFSVDVVVNPATTRTFSEQKNQKGVMNEEFYQEQIKDLKEDRDKATKEVATLQAENVRLQAEVDRLAAESKELDDKVVAIKAEKAALEDEVSKYKAEEALTKDREHCISLCAESGLDTEDSEIVSKLFIESLVKADSDEERQSLIDERVTLAGRRVEVTGEQTATGVRIGARRSHKGKEFSTASALDGVRFN